MLEEVANSGVDIRDEKGLHAGTNAVWLDRIMSF